MTAKRISCGKHRTLVKFLVKRNVRFRITSILPWCVGHKRVVRTQRMSRNQFFFFFSSNFIGNGSRSGEAVGRDIFRHYNIITRVTMRRYNGV